MMDLTQLSDSDLAALHSGDLTQLSDAGLSALHPNPPAVVQPPEPSTWDTVLRKLALSGRAVGEGVYGTLALPNTIGVGLQNLMAKGANAAFGTHLATNAPNQAEQFSNALTSAGAYTPQSPGENYLTAGVRGVSGALTGAGALTGLTGATTSIPNAIRTGVTGATSAGASEAARQAGLGPLAQFGVGLGAGLGVSTLDNIGRASWNAAKSIIDPFTESGQQDIAATTFAGQANNPQTALARLQGSSEIVPGSVPTAGAASGDSGLLSLEKYLRSKNTPLFADRVSAQNSARQAALSDIGGVPGDIEAAQTARDTAASALRANAFASASPANISPVVDRIDSILASPAGQRDVVANSLNWLRSKLVDDEGIPQTDPASLYEIRKDLNDAIAGKLGGDQSVYKLAQGSLIDVRNHLDSAINQAAPGFSNYLAKYAQMSRPITEMQNVQELQNAASTQSSVDPATQLKFLSSAIFNRRLNTLQDDPFNNVQPANMTTLENVGRDLQNSQAINGPLVKAPGSDTFQNLAMNEGLSKFGMFSKLGKPILGPLYNFSGADTKIVDALTQGVLDPQTAANMLRRAALTSMQKANQAAASSAASGYGTLGSIFGSASSVPYLTR